MTFDSRNNGIIDNLDPVFAEKVRNLLQYLTNLGEDILLTSGRRTPAEQNALFAQGRTEPGEVITDVSGTGSFHVWGVAIDFVPVTNGQPDYSDDARLQKIARLAIGMGFEWGFALWGFDKPHLQYTQGLTISDFQKGEKLKEPQPQIIKWPDPNKMAPQVAARMQKNLEHLYTPPAVGDRLFARLKKLFGGK